MSRDDSYDTTQIDETEYPSVPWPRGREIADAGAPDRPADAETVDSKAAAHAFARSIGGIPRRRDHV